MIDIENTVTPSPEQWKAIIMGLRNPMNSWNKYDSGFVEGMLEDEDTYIPAHFEIGPNDWNLMMKLAKGGSDDRKFMRMITVYLDITAPLYWWKEFDTYKVGTVANSCSTMHKIHAKEFALEDFSYEHLLSDSTEDMDSMQCLDSIINTLNMYRDSYLRHRSKEYWWQMIQLLPTSYNQKRTVMLNYEVLRNIYFARRFHKLDEWHDFCAWIEKLPYAYLITMNKASLAMGDQPGLQWGEMPTLEPGQLLNFGA